MRGGRTGGGGRGGAATSISHAETVLWRSILHWERSSPEIGRDVTGPISVKLTSGLREPPGGPLDVWERSDAFAHEMLPS